MNGFNMYHIPTKFIIQSEKALWEHLAKSSQIDDSTGRNGLWLWLRDKIAVAVMEELASFMIYNQDESEEW